MSDARLALFARSHHVRHNHTAIGLAVSPHRDLHLFGIVSLVASTSILDLRLLGTGPLHHWPVSKLSRRLPPVGVVGPGRAACYWAADDQLGESQGVCTTRAFRVKMLLILLAGVNFWLFHQTSFKRVADWENDRVSPLPARLAGFFSIVLWFGIVAAGRYIAYY